MARAVAHGLNNYVCEYMLKPAFWILALFLGIVWVVFIWAELPATHASAHQGPSLEGGGVSQKEDDSDMTASHREVDAPGSPTSSHRTAGSRSLKPRLTLWLAPALDSPAGRFIAAVVYLFFLGAALLEAYWLLVTFGRATSKMAESWSVLASRSPPPWVYGGYALGFGGMLLLDFVAFCFAAAVVVPFALCVFELIGSTYPVTGMVGVDPKMKSKS